MARIVLRTEIMGQYERTMRTKTPSDIAITYQSVQHHIGILNAFEMGQQINDWWDRGFDMRVNDYNSKEFEVEGRKWFVLVVQVYKDGELDRTDNPPCPMSLMLFNTAVSGYTYAFVNQQHRDTFATAIQTKKKITYMSIPENPDKKVSFCSICNGPFCGIGNNPQPILADPDARCCDNCNLHMVLPERMRLLQQGKNPRGEGVERLSSFDIREILKEYPVQHSVLPKPKPEPKPNPKPLLTDEELLAELEGVGKETKQKKETAKERKARETREANRALEAEKREREAFYERAGMATAKKTAKKSAKK